VLGSHLHGHLSRHRTGGARDGSVFRRPVRNGAGVQAADPSDPKGFQLLSVGVGIFLDKYRLEMGEASEVVITGDMMDQAILLREPRRPVRCWGLGNRRRQGHPSSLPTIRYDLLLPPHTHPRQRRLPIRLRPIRVATSSRRIRSRLAGAMSPLCWRRFGRRGSPTGRMRPMRPLGHSQEAGRSVPRGRGLVIYPRTCFPFSGNTRAPWYMQQSADQTATSETAHIAGYALPGAGHVKERLCVAVHSGWGVARGSRAGKRRLALFEGLDGSHHRAVG